MNDEELRQDELMLDAYLIPSLDAAAQTWYEARQQFQMEPCRQNQNAYEKATNELGLAFSAWSTQLPELAEQFRFWFQTHGASGELVLKSCFLPSLDLAIKRWYAARHRFQSQPNEKSLADYGEATNILYLSFERGYENDLRTPDAFEEFRASLIKAEEIDPTRAAAE